MFCNFAPSIFSRASIFIFTAIAIILAAEIEAKESIKTIELPQVTVIASESKDGEVEGYKTGTTRSSTRTETPLLDVPQSVSVVTQDQIRDQNITSMEEAVRYIPGVNIQQGEGNRDAVTIRGQGTTADFFIDGARDDAQYFRDFYNIDRIEFLKGPNAMAFGRGGSGGVINRVAKFADGKKTRQIVLSGGSFDNRRLQADIGDKVNEDLALRLNTMYEKSNTFRKYGDLERFGFNPTATFNLAKNTDLKVGYEYFRDQRFNDRGIPSSNGGAYKTDAATFFGNPNENNADTELNSVYSIFSHDFSPTLQLKNQTRFTKNDKFYQNVYANLEVQSNGEFNLAAYNQSVSRNNITNQTDLTKKFETGSFKHLALIGSEITRQDTKSFKNTGYFNNSSESANVSVNNPLNFDSITYRQKATDADSKSEVNVFAGYVQDQIEINKYLQLTGGIRIDRFEIDLSNNRNGKNFQRTDTLISPRAGIVVKPQENLSFYSSYSVSYLPSSGDQFSSLDATTSVLKPEQLQNYEIGAKWDVNPKLNLTAAIFQLDRTNTKSVDPNDASRYILSGGSRTRGVELGATGKISDKWQVIAGYAYQDAYVTDSYNTSLTNSIKKGNQAQLAPRNKFSLWNKYDFTNKFALAIGSISQSSQFAAADNRVRLKGFTRFDAAAYYKINSANRLQLNVENIFNRNYIQSAHTNNNLQPGSSRAFKISLVTDF
ncbi:MAG: TonB-dependent siderophore receptor [Rickettsiales bacterium]|nr:TonB-dependent siderophore receptor [Rickettsiales bacterium]